MLAPSSATTLPSNVSVLPSKNFISEDQWELIKWIPWAADQLNYSDVHLRIGQRPHVRHHGQIASFGVDKLPAVTFAMIDALMSAFHISDWSDRLKTEYRIAAAGDLRGHRFRVQATFEVAAHDPMGNPSPAITLRRLPSKVQTLAQLALPPAVLKLLSSGSGLMLVVGETGSGKTSTLASLIEEFNLRAPIHVATIEDPVEYIHEPKKALFTRKEVGKSTTTFAAALRDVLREDPDIIMVGEIRDTETMRVALTAAETGHLVLGTLHASGGAQAIDRILNFFPPHEHASVAATLATTLRGIMAQRLMPSIENSSRVLGYELLGVNPQIANLIRDQKLQELHSAITNPAAGADRDTLVLLNTHLLELVVEGKISPTSALRAAYDNADMKAKLTDKGIPYPVDFAALWA